MSFYHLPWAVGPLPIVVTIWSFISYSSSLLLKTGITNKNFLSPYMLSLGIFSFLTSKYMGQVELYITLIPLQLLSVIATYCLFNISNKLSSNKQKRLFLSFNENLIEKEVGDYLLYFFLGFIALDAVILFVPVRSACTIAKCYVAEFLFGAKNDVFATVYFANLIGGMLLWGIANFYAQKRHLGRQTN